MDIYTLGWKSSYERAYQPYADLGYEVGRIALEHKHMYRVYTKEGELLAELSGKMRFNAMERQDYPAVGDWVVMQARPNDGRAIIQAILPRQSKFSRKSAGQTSEEQIVAANVDIVFIVTSLNQDFNKRRLERYLILAWDSGASPVIVLSKSDLCQDIDFYRREVESVAVGIPIHVISSLANQGMEEIRSYVHKGNTAALIGSSGVGKSSIVNHLMQSEQQSVNQVRLNDDRGRHTTTYREMFILPGGGLMIDTPGMREIQLLDAEEGFHEAYSEIEQWAENCQFRDCKHEREPGCAIIQAITSGELDSSRFESYKKLQKEILFMEKKEKQKQKMQEKMANHKKKMRSR